MPSLETAFEILLKREIEKVRVARLEQLGEGAATLEQYKFEAGFLAGLKEATALCDEVHDKMFKDEDR